MHQNGCANMDYLHCFTVTVPATSLKLTPCPVLDLYPCQTYSLTSDSGLHQTLSDISLTRMCVWSVGSSSRTASFAIVMPRLGI